MMKLLGALVLFAVLAVSGYWWFGLGGWHELGARPEIPGGGVSAAERDLETPESATSFESNTREDSRQHVEPEPPLAAAQTAPEITVIEVLALDREARPVSNAGVNLGLAPAASSGLYHFQSDPRGLSRKLPSIVDVAPDDPFPSARTDENGLATFRLLERGQQDMEAEVWVFGPQTVAHKILPPPLSSTRLTLTLQSYARLEVSVLDSARHPRAGVYVDVKALTDTAGIGRIAMRNIFAKTDEKGIAVFDEICDGVYEFSCDDPSTHTRLHDTVRTELEGQYFVELAAPSDPALQMCVAGTVVSETGEPLPKIQVRVSVDGGAVVAVFSDDQGAFSQRCARGREVELSVGGGMWDDDFEPSQLRVPFGTKDIRLRRLRVAEVISVEFVCLDATTGEAVPTKRVSGKRYRAGEPNDSASFQFVGSSATTLLFKAHDDWHVVIKGWQYLSQDISLAESMTNGPNGDKVIVRLLRGPNFNPDLEDDQ